MGIAENATPMGWQRLLVEPRRPESVRNRENAYWLAVAAVCIGAFMGQLDASIVTVALPTLQRTFHASVGAVTWVGLSYLLVLVATVTAVGRFADMWGRKLLYVYGFAIFVIGSALCGLAPSLGALIAFRVLQAVGAAMLQANSVAIIVIAVPRASLGKAIGIQGAAQAIGLALGPSIGGLLLAAGGWRLIFMVNVPFGVLGVIAGLLLIPRSLHLSDRVPFDWLGLGLFFPAVVAVLSAISFGNTYGWTSPLDHGGVRPRPHPRHRLRVSGSDASRSRCSISRSSADPGFAGESPVGSCRTWSCSACSSSSPSTSSGGWGSARRAPASSS